MKRSKRNKSRSKLERILLMKTRRLKRDEVRRETQKQRKKNKKKLRQIRLDRKELDEFAPPEHLLRYARAAIFDDKKAAMFKPGEAKGPVITERTPPCCPRRSWPSCQGES